MSCTYDKFWVYIFNANQSSLLIALIIQTLWIYFNVNSSLNCKYLIRDKLIMKNILFFNWPECNEFNMLKERWTKIIFSYFPHMFWIPFKLYVWFHKIVQLEKIERKEKKYLVFLKDWCWKSCFEAWTYLFIGYKKKR